MDARKLGNAPLGPEAREVLQKWHSTYVPCLMADAGFLAALGALRQGSGLPSESPVEREFCDSVALLASLAVAKTAKRQSFEQLWAQNTGKAWKALTEFPNRLRNMAKEVERMNGSFFFSPTLLVGDKVPRDSVQNLASRFAELPNILSYYANGIEAIAKELPAVTSEHYWREPGHSPWIDQLSQLVNQITGHFQDPEVAKLLSAARAVLRPNERNVNKGYDAQTLADYRFRRKRKARKR
jgi:hypothetical protein